MSDYELQIAFLIDGIELQVKEFRSRIYCISDAKSNCYKIKLVALSDKITNLKKTLAKITLELN